MDTTVWQWLDGLARRLLPFATTVLLVMLSVLPLPIPGYGVVAPALALMAVYYWSIFRPDLMPSVAVVLLGLFQDSLSGMPFGVSALALLVVHGIVSAQRRFFLGKSFAVMWWGFMLISAGVAFGTWILLMVLSWSLIDPLPVVFRFALTLALFPCLTWVFIRMQQGFLRQV